MLCEQTEEERGVQSNEQMEVGSEWQNNVIPESKRRIISIGLTDKQ